MAKSFNERAFAIVDVETTGGSPVTDRVIEIGIIRIEGGEITETFSSLVNPERPVPSMIQTITGIAEGELASAPVFEEIAVDVKRLLSGAVFVAHNARFDYGFVKSEFARLGDAYAAKCLCTVRLSRKLEPWHRKHDLSSIIERHAFECASRHRAYDDAYVLWQLLSEFRKSDIVSLDEAIARLLGNGSLPQLLPAGAVADLPDGPGVYIFYGPEDETLYVGKSVNIRQRVLSHFSSDSATTRGMNMYQQVARIEARETAGELGALLLESELIKSLQPLYNKVARKRRKLVLATAAAEPSGYRSVRLELADRIEPESHADILGVFKSRSQAKKKLALLAAEHSLCERLLGAETGKGPCFGSQIGRCKGACSGREAATEYNERFDNAFSERRIRTWPFPGPVAIEEKSGSGSGEAFIVDNWCLVGSVRYDEEGNREEREHPHDFDYDNYKILARHLLTRSHAGTVRGISSHETAFGSERVIE